MLSEDRCIISPPIVIQVQECTLGVNIINTCAILLADTPAN